MSYYSYDDTYERYASELQSFEDQRESWEYEQELNEALWVLGHFAAYCTPLPGSEYSAIEALITFCAHYAEKNEDDIPF